jgi:hypothetical protein
MQIHCGSSRSTLDWSGRRSDDGNLKDAIAGKPCFLQNPRNPLQRQP